MQLTSWLPSITTTGLLALALWLFRKLIATRLASSVEHEFNAKLESLKAELRAKEEIFKADLRSKETEIASLRGTAMTALASRQVALDERRLEAVDQLWTAVTALGPAKGISSFMAVMKFEAIAEAASKSADLRNIFTAFGAGTDLSKLDLSSSAKARPFISPMAWALFSAYQAIAVQAVLKLEMIKTGVSGSDLLNKDAVQHLVKAALPHRAEYVDAAGEAGLHNLLDELEGRLLDELRKMLAGVEADEATLEQAAEILRRVDKLVESPKSAVAP